jgi:hypothetical protein
VFSEQKVESSETPARGSRRIVHCQPDLPRESVPTGGRDCSLAWSVAADISDVYRTPQTQFTTSSNLVVSVACSALSGSSFSGPPFTAEGGTESSFPGQSAWMRPAQLSID